VAVPLADGVNVIEQVPLTKVHVGALKLPADPVLDQVIVPVGVEIVPGDVSVTVAEHVAGVPIVPVGGQVTTVLVDLLFTVIVLLGVAAPAACIVSPP